VNLPQSSVGKNVLLTFVGIRGNGPLGDIAIDEVDLLIGLCPGILLIVHYRM